MPFTYVNSLERPYSSAIDHKIKSVTFDISRYGEHSEAIRFNHPVSEKVAIECVEQYLSRPLTQEVFETIKDDIFHDDMSWEEAQAHYECIGDCLMDAKFLEAIEIDDKGDMTFFIGS
jgi:hypothetical protein